MAIVPVASGHMEIARVGIVRMATGHIRPARMAHAAMAGAVSGSRVRRATTVAVKGIVAKAGGRAGKAAVKAESVRAAGAAMPDLAATTGIAKAGRGEIVRASRAVVKAVRAVKAGSSVPQDHARAAGAASTSRAAAVETGAVATAAAVRLAATRKVNDSRPTWT
jgi:hypothetical protein